MPGVRLIVATACVLTLDRPAAANDRRREHYWACVHARVRRTIRTANQAPGDRSPVVGVGTAHPQDRGRWLRSLLDQPAQYLLCRFDPDSELLRWGHHAGPQMRRAGREENDCRGGSHAGGNPAQPVA